MNKPSKIWRPDFPLQPRRWPFFYGWMIVVFATLGVSASMPGQTVGVSVFTARLADALGLSYLPLMDARPWLAPGLVLVVGFALLRFTGQGMVTMSSRAMLGKWFNRRRGVVTAWSGAVVSFAFSGAPMGFEYLIRQLGWQGAWQLMGLVMICVLALLFWIFARDNPEECGLEMDGDYVGKEQRENLDSVIYRDYTLAEARRTFAFWAD